MGIVSWIVLGMIVGMLANWLTPVRFPGGLGRMIAGGMGGAFLGGATFSDGLAVCRQLKSLPAPPRILIYSAFVERGLGLAAAVAGADGVVDKGVPSEELFERVRTVARGKAVLAITPEAMTRQPQSSTPRTCPSSG